MTDEPILIALELKECERCPRKFTREVGSDERLCRPCRIVVIEKHKEREKKWRGDAPARGQAYLAELDRRMSENTGRHGAPPQRQTRYQELGASRRGSSDACARKDGLTRLQAEDVKKRMRAAGRKVMSYHCSPGCGKHHVAGVF